MLATATGTWLGVSLPLKERDRSDLVPDPSSVLERLEDAPRAPPASSKSPGSSECCSAARKQQNQGAGLEQKDPKLLQCRSLQLSIPPCVHQLFPPSLFYHPGNFGQPRLIKSSPGLDAEAEAALGLMAEEVKGRKLQA